MKTKLFLCVVGLAVTLLPNAGLADDKKDRREHPEKKIFAELGITPEQEAKLKEIRSASAPTKKLYLKQIDVVRQKVKVELQKEKPSKAALNKYAAEIGNLHKQMNLASIDRLLKVKAVLTPEQFNRLSERGFMHGSGGPDRDKMRMMHRPRDGKEGDKFKKPQGDGYGPEGAQFRKHRYRDKENGRNQGGGVPAETESQPAAPENNADGGEEQKGSP
jgi:Spy/CpxP family protein refolding chaperone